MSINMHKTTNLRSNVNLILTRSIILCLILGFSSISLSQSLNERLGFSPEQKLLILHVDDLGNFDSTTRAAQSLFTFGLAQSGSVMTLGPEAQSVTYVLNDRVDLGIHLTLSSEFSNRPWTPVMALEQIPSLIDRQGKLQTLMNQLMWGSSQEIEAEMEAQILRGIELGMKPSHLDSHMGSVFFKPSWFKAYLKLSKKYKLVPFLPKLAQGTQQLLGFSHHFVGPAINALLRRATKAGFLLVDDFYLLKPPHQVITYESRKNQYIDLIKNLKSGVSLVVLHPTFSDFDFKAAVVKNNNNQVFRDHEARILMDADFKKLIEDEGIKLISWKEIAAIYPWADIKDID